MSRIHSEAPYYDDYDPSKHYSVILTKPGYGAQARENTQLQTMIYDYMSRLGDYLIKDGSIIEGCVPVLQEDPSTHVLTLSISEGKIYLDGLVRLVEAASVELDGVGTELVGCKLVSTIITAVQDPTLNDPAAGADNYGQEGADRLKEVVVFVKDDTEAVALWAFENGELITAPESNENNVLTDVLARRTFDESGSYKVEGLELFEKDMVDGSKIYVSLSAGKAYIKGYEVTKPYTATLEFNRALEYLESYGSTPYYSTTSEYLLANQPCKRIIKVVGPVMVTNAADMQHTRGNVVGTADNIHVTPVYEVYSVYDNNRTYELGVDYQIVNNTIDWSLLHNQPQPGDSYTIEYSYEKTFVYGTDYDLYLGTDGLYYIRFLRNGDKPVNTKRFSFEYEYYLARKDLVCMDKEGNIQIYIGDSDVLDKCEAPLNTDSNLLSLGSILFYPNSDRIICNNFNNYRLTMEEIYNLQRRINSLEYNQAVENLDDEAREGESGTNLKGIFTDGFIGLTKSDVNHLFWEASIDLDNEALTIPFDETVQTLILSNANSSISVLGDNITAPYTETVVLNQSGATKTMLVNPYAVYNALGVVSVSPAYDNWIDSSSYKVNGTTITKNYTLRRWWYHRGDSWVESERQKWLQILGTDDRSIDPGYYKTRTTVTTTVVKDTVLDEAILYMRQRELTLTVSNFTPNSDNIYCYFDGRQVNLIPKSGYSSGTAQGTMKANGSGKFVATFTIPQNVACGTVEVKVQSLLNHGSTSFTATGRKVVTRETITKTVVNVTGTDPLAQTFQFDTNRVLTKIGLFFASKDNNKAIVVQIKNVVNGYPGETVYAEEILQPSQISVSSNGTSETVVQLSNFVYCDANVQYCVAILSDSNLYSVFIAELGAKDIRTNKIIASQPYVEGVLFSSSNAATWTAHQTSDLKFKLYAAKFATSGRIVWNNLELTAQTISRFLLASDCYNPNNAEIRYYYKYYNSAISDWTDWEIFNPYVDIQLSSLSSQFQFKIEFNSNTNVSPVFSFGGDNFIGLSDSDHATYVSRNIVLDERYKTVKVVLDAYLPEGTSLRVSYATDGDGNTDAAWKELTPATLIEHTFAVKTYEFNDTIAGSGELNYRIRIDLTTNNSLQIPYVAKLKSILKY